MSMRRRKPGSTTSILRESPSGGTELSVDNLVGFLKRKLPAAASLVAGVLIGLVVSTLLAGNVSLLWLQQYISFQREGPSALTRRPHVYRALLHLNGKGELPHLRGVSAMATTAPSSRSQLSSSGPVYSTCWPPSQATTHASAYARRKRRTNVKCTSGTRPSLGLSNPLHQAR